MLSMDEHEVEEKNTSVRRNRCSHSGTRIIQGTKTKI